MVVVAVFEIKSISNHMEFSNYSFASSLLVYQDVPASYLNPKQASVLKVLVLLEMRANIS